MLRWREYAPLVAEAVKEVLGGAEVYVFGSAAEGRLTASSDIDIAVVVDEVPKSAFERAGIVLEIIERAERRGLPSGYPLEIHLMTRRDETAPS